MRGTKKNISAILVCFLVFLSFLIPRNISVFKLCVIIMAILTYYISKPLRINTHLTSMKFMCLYLVYSIGTSFRGFWNGNPDVFLLFRLNVIYFLMLYVWSLIIDNRELFKDILKTCCWVAIGISVYTLLFFAQQVHFINLPFFIYLDNASGAMIHNGYVHITNMNMSMMLFLFPVVLFINKIDEFKNNTSFIKLNKWAIILSVFAMMLSGRRIVWIVLFGSLICYMLFKREKTIERDIQKNIVVIVGTILVFLVFSRLLGISLDGFIMRFKEAFADTDNYGRENVRWLQLKALWRGFLKNPILGSGFGIGVSDLIRSTDSSASYELSYALILYNSGVLMFIPYVLSLVIVLKKLWKYGKNDGIARALFFGLFFGLISNATNPYFSSSFDFLLWIFIPLMYLNVYEM